VSSTKRFFSTGILLIIVGLGSILATGYVFINIIKLKDYVHDAEKLTVIDVVSKNNGPRATVAACIFAAVIIERMKQTEQEFGMSAEELIDLARISDADEFTAYYRFKDLELKSCY